MSSQPIPYPLRMPDELREQLNERARMSGRSLNAEIVAMLQDAMSGRQQSEPGPGLNVDALADALAERLAAKLKTS